jgi:hypothetical protein
MFLPNKIIWVVIFVCRVVALEIQLKLQSLDQGINVKTAVHNAYNARTIEKCVIFSYIVLLKVPCITYIYTQYIRAIRFLITREY